MQKSFNFILSSYSDKQLKLVLVDTTADTSEKSIVSKVMKFKAKLLTDANFNASISKLCESD